MIIAKAGMVIWTMEPERARDIAIFTEDCITPNDLANKDVISLRKAATQAELLWKNATDAGALTRHKPIREKQDYCPSCGKESHCPCPKDYCPSCGEKYPVLRYGKPDDE